MRFYSRNQTCKSFAIAKSFLYLFSILLLLLPVNGNSVRANQGNTSQIQFVKPQNNSGNEDQIQATIFNNYLPLIMNGLPVPSEFNKNAPANGTTGTTLAPVLSWNISTNATKYEYCYDTTNDNSCNNWISTGTNNYVGLWALQPATTYYWQVRSWNETYGPTYANGSASAYWSFTTMVLDPGAFNKNAPADGTTGTTLAPVLSWNISTNATQYEYCYDTTNDGTCSTWISTGTNNYVGLWALQPATTYYWQVRSWNGTYGPTYANGSASAYWSFTTMVMAPGAFNKNAPADGTAGTTLAPVLSWNVSTNATQYEYCYDTTNDGSCSNWISTGTNNYVGLWALQPATTYYWQVRVWNGTYGPTYANGSASAYWSFTTMVMAPGAFNKNAPADGTAGTTLAPVLSWNVSTNATQYEYCYDTTNDGSCSNWVSTGTNNYVGLWALQPATTYYWQVRSWNGTYGPAYANGSASAYWGFTTIMTIQNPFLNPGFEEGATSWSQSSSGGWDLILPSVDTPISAHDGSWLAWLGGADEEVSQLSQTITISVAAPYMHFWYWTASEDECGYDFFLVGVNNNYFYTKNLCSSTNTNGWVQMVLDLSAYVGSNKTVMFSVTTDEILNSNLFLDDVSMSASATMAHMQPVATERYPGAAILSK